MSESIRIGYKVYNASQLEELIDEHKKFKSYLDLKESDRIAFLAANQIEKKYKKIILILSVLIGLGAPSLMYSLLNQGIANTVVVEVDNALEKKTKIYNEVNAQSLARLILAEAKLEATRISADKELEKIIKLSKKLDENIVKSEGVILEFEQARDELQAGNLTR